MTELGSRRRMSAKRLSVVGAAALVLAVLVVPSSASPRPSPTTKLLRYLWNYDNWLLRPYVIGVTLSGGHTATVKGKTRLTTATANVDLTLRDDSELAATARHICRVAAAGVDNLHLRATISTVRVWSIDGHTIARCSSA